MKIPAGATDYSPPVHTLVAGIFRGGSLRHTYRSSGTSNWLLIYTTDGSGLYQTTGGDFRSEAGDCTLYRPGAFQDYQVDPAVKKWGLVFAHFLPRADWLSWLDWPERAPDFMVLRLSDLKLRRQVRDRLQDVVRLSTGVMLRSEEFARNALEEALLRFDSVNPRRVASQTDPRVRLAMDYLATHLAEPFSETSLARAAGLSASRLRHIFRAETGFSPRAYLEERRLRRAEDLLLTSRQNIAGIALEVGFENPFYFTLRFKKQTGENPRHFRQRRLGIATG